MPHPSAPPRAASRWVNAVLVVFTLFGFGFGSWLARLPAVRDHLGASTFEMSLIGLTLATGSLIGLVFAGRSVSWLGPRRALLVTVLGQAACMPAVGVLLWFGLVAPGAICLALYGFMFSTGDVAMNVSGADAERAVRRPRMPLLHAGFSLGSVASMGVGALAEAARIPVPIHIAAVFAAVAAGTLLALRRIPRREGHDAEPDTGIGANINTGPVQLVGAAPAASPNRYNPWRDPRVIVIGLIAMSMSLGEGTASDWLPLALADGRGFGNASATLALGAFFVSMMLTRVAGSWLLLRFGRVKVLRGGAVLVVFGVAIVNLAPFAWAAVLGSVLWGMGCALGFPIGISAAADDPRTAVRGVAAVSAISYGAFLLGPMGIGFLGEHFGLLRAFLLLIAFALFVVVFAGWARERGPAR